MPTVAFVFPGQGSQSVGMGREIAAGSTAAAAVFDDVDRALGESISRLAWEGPEETLNRTENAQPALLATSIAYLRAMRERWEAAGIPAPTPRFMAGHSMGQYSALVASGAIGLEDGARLVRERGLRMQASGSGREGAMAAIIGLDDAALPELARRAAEHGVFTIANRNAPGQVVISGEREAVAAGSEIARELGARRAVILPVTVAAHSPLMADAAEGMRAVIAGVAFGDPEVPLVANADARAITTAEGCRDELVEHLTQGVDWVRAIGTMVSTGVDTFIEVGPGKVLTGLIRRIAPDAATLALDEPSAPDRLALPFA